MLQTRFSHQACPCGDKLEAGCGLNKGELQEHSPSFRNHFGGYVRDQRGVEDAVLIVDEMGGRRGCSDGGVGVSMAVVTMLAKTAARLV